MIERTIFVALIVETLRNTVTKLRGYFFKIKNDFVFKCHNCGVGRTLTNFLKDQSPMLHDQYVMERYKEGLTGKNTQTASPKFDFKTPLF